MTFQTTVLRFVDTCNLHNIAIDSVEWDRVFDECFKEDAFEFEFIPHLVSLDEDHAAELYSRGGGEAVRAANIQRKEIFLREGGGDLIRRDAETGADEETAFIRWETKDGIRRWFSDYII